MKRVRGAPPATPASVRSVAACLIDEIFARPVPVEPLLARASDRLEARDARLLAELVYGVARWRRRLDHVIERAAARPLSRIDAPLRAVLEIGALQLLVLERVPAHAAVSEAVDEARRRGGRAAAGFVNGVLRAIARSPRLDAWPVEAADPRRRLAIEHSHPDELVGRWWHRFGQAATRRILEANNGPRRLHLLCFAARGGRDRVAERLAAEGVVTRPSTLAPQGLTVESGQPIGGESFRSGDFYVQDEASQAAALVPFPHAGERVLDAAAAPGGKGLALVAAEPTARIVFGDVDLGRVLRLAENLARLGLRAPVAVADGRRLAFGGAFDRVVLDAPCTGTGTLRRHPELRWRFGSAELARLAGRSLELLEGLAGAPAVGGLLALVTCSIEEEENERVAARFLARHAEFRALSLAAAEVPPGGREELAAGRWCVLPGDGHDGFTVSVLQRK